MKKAGLKTFEIALLAALCITLCYGTYLNASRQNLTSNIIRFHVIAASDEAEEQELKLLVRDGVTRYLNEILDGAQDIEEARRGIVDNLDNIESTAAALSDGRKVTVQFGTSGYPARQGEGYSLPAGEYVSLRVTLGEGAGHNWWGVIFPELTPDSTEYIETGALSERGISLIAEEDDEGYVIKFKTLEYIDSIAKFFKSE